MAAALAGIGLLVQLAGARVAVITEQPVSLVAGESTERVTDHAEGGLATDRHRAADDGTLPATALTNGAALLTVPVQSRTPAAEPSPSPSPQPTEAPEPSPVPGAARRRPAADTVPAGPPRPTADVPIVMYHHIGSLPPNPDIYRRDLTVSPELFERTLTRLAEQEVTTVTMAELFEHFQGGAALPKRAAVLTFDDGYDDNYDHAFRLLQAHGMVGTFFITTDFVGRPGYLTWAQIAEMAEAGMEIGAHSANHADFAAISPHELRRQLVEPKTLLEERLGQPVRFLAYPAGKYTPSVMAASKAAGYAAAVTVLHGIRHVPAQAFELRRVRARGADTAPEIINRMTPPSWR